MKSTPSNLPNCKISWNNENVWIWNQICLIWVVLRCNLKTMLLYLKSAPSNLPNYKMLPKNKNALIWDQKTIVLFQISTLEFFKLQNFGKKQKYLVWVYLGLKFKKLLSYLKSDPRICFIAKFCVETKMPKFGTKNAWFGYFGAGIWKYYCHIWNQHPQICLIAKCTGNTEILKFVTKNALFGYFGL